MGRNRGQVCDVCQQWATGGRVSRVQTELGGPSLAARWRIHNLEIGEKKRDGSEARRRRRAESAGVSVKERRGCVSAGRRALSHFQELKE